MKKKVCLALVLAMVLVMVTSALAFASSDATIYVIHGINGKDIGQPDSALPVDISVGGVCAIRNFTYGQVLGPISMTPGSVTLAVYLHTPAGCQGTPVIGPVSPSFAGGHTYAIVARPSVDSTGALTGVSASVYDLNVSRTGHGMSRFGAYHDAVAPAVDAHIARDPMSSNAPNYVLENVSNPNGGAIGLRPGGWFAWLTLPGQSAAVFGPIPLAFKPYSAYFVFVTGSLTNGIRPIVITVPGLK